MGGLDVDDGDDSLFGEAGDDFLDGHGLANGTPGDILDGSPGFDVCEDGETVVNCEDIEE